MHLHIAILTDKTRSRSLVIFFDETKHLAPIIIAKTKKIKTLILYKIAKKYSIQVFRNNDLFHSLNRSILIDKPIQKSHYSDIADIIINSAKAGGKFKEIPEELLYV